MSLFTLTKHLCAPSSGIISADCGFSSVTSTTSSGADCGSWSYEIVISAWSSDSGIFIDPESPLVVRQSQATSHDL